MTDVMGVGAGTRPGHRKGSKLVGTANQDATGPIPPSPGRRGKPRDSSSRECGRTGPDAKNRAPPGEPWRTSKRNLQSYWDDPAEPTPRASWRLGSGRRATRRALRVRSWRPG